jgi:hypothetical protein
MFIDTPRIVSIAVVTGLLYRHMCHVQMSHGQREAAKEEARYITRTLPFF